jgi:alpha-beta hydrolase superfamily lysophospholipase
VLCLYLFSGSEDPVGQELQGVRTLIDRHRRAGVRNISHDFYPGARHEMLNELNRGKVRSNLLAWLSAVLGIKLLIRSRYASTDKPALKEP